MEILEIPVEKINLAEYNPRVDLQPDDDEYKQIKKSLNEFGCVELLVWNKRTGNLVSGHQRLKVLIADGAKTIMCSVVDLDPNREKALNIALNKISGKWVDEKVASIFAEFENADFDAPVTGFSDSEISGLIDKFFDVEIQNDTFDVENDYEEISEPETKPGDIWQLGRHKLFSGDSTGDLSLLLENGQANMMITDPPYNVDYTGCTKENLKIVNDNMSNDDFHNLLKSSFANANLLLKPGGAFYIWYSHAESENFLKACRENDLMVKQHLIWVKNMFVLGRQDYHYRHEPCLYGWKSGARHYFTEKRNLDTVIDKNAIDIDALTKKELRDVLNKIVSDTPSDILNFNKPTINREHPTMKPVELFADLIRNSSQRGDVVLDLFAGSGTTVMACEATRRIARIVEFDPKYCDVIVHRFKASYPDAEVYKIN